MKILLDLYRPTVEQIKQIKDAGYYVYHTRFYDCGDGESLENHSVLVNYGQTVVCDEEPKWEETYKNFNGFEEKWINDLHKYIDDNDVEIVEDGDEMYEKVKNILGDDF